MAELAQKVIDTVCRYLTAKPRSLAEVRALGVGLSAGATDADADGSVMSVRKSEASAEDCIRLGTMLINLAAEGRVEEARIVGERLIAIDYRFTREVKGVLRSMKPIAGNPPKAKRIGRQYTWMMQAQVDEMMDLVDHPRITKRGSPEFRVAQEATGPSDPDFSEQSK